MVQHTGDLAQARQVAVRAGEPAMPAEPGLVAASASVTDPRDPAWLPPDDNFR